MKARIAGPLALACGLSGAAYAADHLDSPAVSEESAADINDLFAFVSPSDQDSIVLIMTVFPAAGADAMFSDAVQYTFNVRRAADGEVRSVDCTFEADGSYQCQGPAGAVASGTVNGEPAAGDSIRAWAGLRDDPFFFDFAAFQRTVGLTDEGAPFCLLDPERDEGTDFFAGLNTLAIVVEIRSEVFTQGLDEENDLLAIWAATTRRGG